LRYCQEDFKDAEGRWLTKCTDRLLVYHALQWSGRDRVAYIPEPLYYYREHSQNSYKTVPTADKERQMAHIMAQPSKTRLESTIHVVMCSWKRTHFLPQQLRCLNEQTLSSRLHLHVLNNNVQTVAELERIVEEMGPTLNFPVTLRHYQNLSYGFERFLYIRDYLLHREALDYVVVIDDDQLFDRDWVERLWSMRQPRTYLGWYCKAWDVSRSLDYWHGSLVSIIDCKRGVGLDRVKSYHYAGTGGALIDTTIFLGSSGLFRTDTCALNVLNIEDLWLSFVVTHYYGWRILRSDVVPQIPSAETEQGARLGSVALFKGLRAEKDALLRYLVTHFRWLLPQREGRVAAILGDTPPMAAAAERSRAGPRAELRAGP
jgi:hypothetical protein